MKHDKETLEAADKESTECFCPILRSMISRSDAQKIGAALFVRGVAYAREKQREKTKREEFEISGRGKIVIEKRKPRIGYVSFHEEEEGEDGYFSGEITGPNDPTGANLAWLKPVPFIEKFAYDNTQKEIAKLKAKLEIAKGALERLEAGFAGMFGHQSVSPQQDFYDRGEHFVANALKQLRDLEE